MSGFLGLAGCLDVQETKKYSISFKLNGVQKTYTSLDGVGFKEYTSFNYWSNLWVVDNSIPDESDKISIRLPLGVRAGDNYNQNTLYFGVSLSVGSVDLYTRTSSSFNLTVTKWDGLGGLAAGTFNGVLANSSSNATITDGVFEASIDDF